MLDLHWTLAQCRMMAGRSADSLATLDQALAAPGISARHRARLLVLTARTHSILGEMDTAGRAAADALEAATEAGDNWAMGWALHVLSLVTAMQGRMTEALPLFDRALTVTQADAALTSLRLLLQINKAISLSSLDRYEEAFTAAREAQQIADRAGTVVQLGNAHSALGQLLFDTGQWDEALAEVQMLQEDLKEPGAACSDHGIAAVIYFHRGEVASARDHLTAAVPNAKRIGNRVIGSLALARSLDSEQAGAVPDALAVLTDGFAEHKDELEELEDLFADAVRLAMLAGDPGTARALTGHAEALATGSEVPHRQANARYCRGLLDHDAAELMWAADRYGEASRPLLRAKALEAAASEFIVIDGRDKARGAFTKAVETYSALGAVTDVARLQTIFRAHGIRRGPHSKHRSARSGWDSLTPTEVKVALLVGDGLSNPEIAAKLFLSRRTVATHVSHILKKLSVHSRTDIAREAALRAAGAQ
jgi:DNA-binding CsgD family transcriptional regulator